MRLNAVNLNGADRQTRRLRSGLVMKTSRGRRGMLSIEMLLLLPLLMLFILAIVQFGMMFHCRQQMNGACREGCRTAATGGTIDDVQESIARCFGGGRLCCSTFKITDQHGNIIDDPTQIPSGEPIEVWVELDTNKAVPDLLGWTGFSIKDDKIVCRTVMRKE